MNGCLKMGVVVGAMLLAACGGEAVVDEQERSVDAVEQASIPASCNGINLTKITCFSDATKTVEVGRRDCLCNGTAIVGGRTSPYRTTMSFACFN
ncbi:hypothetical protein ACN469_10660 [Corallococcus terminator]